MVISKRDTRINLATTVFLLALSILTIAAPPVLGDVPFTYIVIDPNPPLQTHCKAVGDIDGDGYPDALVAGAHDGGGFYWYRYPQWTKYPIVPAGVTGFSTDMQVGDVDNDGDLDAIIPKGYDKGRDVFWYENPRPLGDPSIDAWIEHSIGPAGAHDVEVGDINNDGRLDVVVRDKSTTIFFQETPTTWTPHLINSRTFEGTGLGDIDSDGDIDIAINGYWLENPLPSGNPVTDGWMEYVIDPNWPIFVGALVTDLNADGRADVVLCPSETSGRFSWYEGPPSPQSGGWIEHSIQASAQDMHTFKAGDVDLDGDLDLVTSEMSQSSDPDEVAVYYNEGGALSWTKQIVATTGSHNIRIADMGSDGDIDIVGANWQGETPFEMWQNELNPSLSLDLWERHVVDATRPWRAIFITAGDLNGDEMPDIITGGWWYQNPGDPQGNWVRRELGAPLNNMAAVYDFDGDGRLDVLGTQGVGSATNAALAWAHNDGQGTFTILDNIAAGTGDFLQGIAVGRFQGGALAVALSWHSSSAGLQRLTLPSDPLGGTWPIDQLSPTTQDEELSAGDIDRDGDIDLLLGTTWLRNDQSAWTPVTLANANKTPDRNRLADINGDGRLDAVIGFEHTEKLAWYEQGVTATDLWIEHPIATDFFAPMSLDVGDLDRDGDVDVVVGEHNLTDPSSARVYVYENNNRGATWMSHVVHVGDEHHDGTQLIDIDNDGDKDIISIGWDHSNVLLYENKAIDGGPPVNRPPVAAFTADPESGFVPLDVTFDASASSDPDGDVLTYAWDFGDGGTANGAVTAHTYTAEGTHIVTLTVSDGEFTGAEQRTITADIEITNQPPTASFTADPESGFVPLDVSFDASASSDPENDVLTYSWDFGDGAGSNVVAPSHTFTQTGAFVVTLTVSDGEFNDSAEQTIVVQSEEINNPPVAAFTMDKDSGQVPLEVTFDASVSSDPEDDVLSYTWDFGDGSTGSGVGPAHTFTEAGTLTVTLTVSDGEFSDSAEMTVVVVPAPVLDLTLGILQNPYLTQFLDVYLVASSPLNPDSIVVTVGDDTVAMSLNDASANVWKGDYALTGSGVVDIEACATAINGSRSCTSSALSARFVMAMGGAYARSADGRFAIRVADGNVKQDGYLLILPAAQALQVGEPVAAWATAPATHPILPAFSVSPNELINGNVTVEFQYTDISLPDGTELSQLFIEQENRGALNAHVDREAAIVRASARELGTFRLAIGSPGTSPTVDPNYVRMAQNHPNPFNPSTMIEFEVQTQQHVRIAIYDVSGRMVSRLVDDMVPAGTAQATWDGRSSNGEDAVSGIYFARLETTQKVITRKLVLIR